MDNFAFVMNIASIDENRHELFPDHVLRRANDEEIALIKETAVRLVGSSGLVLPTVIWEQKAPPGGVGVWQELEAHEWRYYVIAFKGSNSGLIDFQIASDLASIELEVGFTFVTGGLSWTPDRLFHVLQGARFNNNNFFHAATKQHIEEIVSLSRQIRQSDANLFDARKAAFQLSALKGLSHDSPLRTLGYFALLESLLTHPPNRDDTYDSITRQIKKKLALLNNRWDRRLDYTPFRGVDHERLWSRMYEYRSQLAHGGTPDFGGKLHVLGNQGRVQELVKETVKSIIRQTLIEPRLLLDLREC